MASFVAWTAPGFQRADTGTCRPDSGESYEAAALVANRHERAIGRMALPIYAASLPAENAYRETVTSSDAPCAQNSRQAAGDDGGLVTVDQQFGMSFVAIQSP